MRCLGFVVLAAALCGNAFALETAAGTDTINASQVGINAKIEAGNAVLTAGINQILNCNQDGKFFDAQHNVCTAPSEPLAKKIAACTTSKQFYNQTTDACQSLELPPDLTSNLNTTNSLLGKIIACNNAHQFYNSTSGACEGGGGISAVVLEQCSDGSSGSGGCTTPACPAGYYRTGCSYGYGNSAYIAFGPVGASQCQCGKSHGAGKLTCTAYCAK